MSSQNPLLLPLGVKFPIPTAVLKVKYPIPGGKEGVECQMSMVCSVGGGGYKLIGTLFGPADLLQPIKDSFYVNAKFVFTFTYIYINELFCTYIALHVCIHIYVE